MSGGDIHVIFRVGGVDFALPAEAVVAMHWLPELSTIVDGPDYLIGIFQQEGRAIPVIDLARRLGGGGSYQLSDVVVVAESGMRRIGVLANEVKRLGRGVPLSWNDGVPVSGAETDWVVAALDVDGDIAALIDPARLVPGEGPRALSRGAEPFWPEASQAQRDVLRRRAAALRHPAVEGLAGAENRFALVQTGGERLAFELSQILRFVRLSGVVPMPCTPDYLLGSMNLRGSVVTLIDVAAVTGLAEAARESDRLVAIVSHRGLLAGFPIETVVDLFGFEQGILREPLPGEDRNFVRGEFILNGQVAVWVDLVRLLDTETLVVDERV